MAIVRTVLYMGFLFILPLFLAAQTKDASTFSETVTDSQTEEPIPGVNVYIAGSTAGSSTDSLGHYKFQTPLTGDHQLVFSFVSYKTQSRPIKISTGDSLHINIHLEPLTVQLNEVEVISSNKKWKRNFKYFKQQFLGKTNFAEQTEITTPWVLDFKKDKNILTASANQPLVVINRALGYKIQIELVQFDWNTDTGIGIYQVHSLFEELKAEDSEQKKEWTKNRIETYHGSKAHFFKSLYQNNWQENSYSVRDDRKLFHMSDEDLKYEFLTAGSSVDKTPKGWKAFKLEQQVTIRYNRILKYKIEGKEIKSPLNKVSQIKAEEQDKFFLVNEWGLLKDISSVRLYGVWARNRIANSLPINYTYTP